MDGGGRVEQLTGQLHELNMQLSQLKELNSQLEAQHSTAVEEVDSLLHSEAPSHKQIYRAAAFTFIANVAAEISFQDQFKHIFFKDHILNISFHICPSFVTCIS